jgi:hypothetical protein
VTMEVDLDEQGESLWSAATRDWDDQSGHDRFVQYCFSVGRLAAAGARYRQVLDAETEGPRAAIARRMQERVVVLSMSSLVPSSRRQEGFRLMQSPWLVAIILFGAAVGAALGFVFGARP